jgi:flagellar biosynthesis chaperone FliJ
MDAVAELAKVTQSRDRANARIAELEGQQRAAHQQAQQAAEQHVEAERTDVPEAQRRQLEEKLAEAKAQASAPWNERVEGARRTTGRPTERRSPPSSRSPA